MRKLIYAINLTLDGCCDHTKGVPDAELHEYHRQLLLEAGTFLYGRKTYELMVPFWPDLANDPDEKDGSTKEFALAFQSVQEILVFSRTLTSAGNTMDNGKSRNATPVMDGTWNTISARNHHGTRTRFVTGDVAKEVTRLKEETGKNILTGGVDLPGQLMQAGLIDEIHVLIQPVVAGEGRRLFDELKLSQKLQLLGTKVFQSGTVALHYRKE